MAVRNILENQQIDQLIEQEASGWLVIINNELYLLEENLCEDYKQSFKIKISDASIMYAIRQSILPLGGGESFVFHRATVTGILHMGPTPEINIRQLFIQERGQKDMIAVDISPDAIAAGRKRYEAAFNFDFFKEMGDA